MIEDLFSDDDSMVRQWEEKVAPGATILRGFAGDDTARLLGSISTIASMAPFRQLRTPGGHVMSVSMTSCGDLGWMSDEFGYRYTATDPDTGRSWPSMPDKFRQLAEMAAAAAGYPSFSPDACLINRYSPGARLTLHQDKNERDMSQPIVSVSLGLPAVFLFGGLSREQACARYILTQGDVMVWGGPSRLNYHGVLPLKGGIPPWPSTECVRFNLTFRRVRTH
ncbi:MULTISPECIES: DNA oxidative demethylase AlkB [unclassified Serratia (in: enterobacteria)]|uniref:DNA oxidative demethylase AlkB n=1 Tax=unclassified Serratia (in: enterobacteria) TaxID=2647522 RepID=UPI0024AF075D|nr:MULTISPECIES: DNA oxidative demethylase AlkB [unclassified Serratia (in: enterobacteria)]MDI6948968.1 DNA oxidative demethylase AlkB [Serratia sp. Se-RSmG]MDI9225797.1 DNA oxidative demethylase AlkB [Serratia bockelmannii]MDI9265895.1 DNA oxidative demethylase AlkB [Serratia sp. PF2-63]MDI9267137.1 DNA oxidative demethylase AlkB [Serratia sp. PF-27]